MKLIHGNNFSGRSALLKKIVKYNANTQDLCRRVYISEIPVDNLTGIMPTVKDELYLHDMQANYRKIVYELLSELGLKKYELKNPYSLSGGE